MKGAVFHQSGAPATNAVVKVGAFDVVEAASELVSMAMLQRMGIGASRWGEEGSSVHQQIVMTTCTPSESGEFLCPLIVPARSVFVAIVDPGCRPWVRQCEGPYDGSPTVLDVGRVTLVGSEEALTVRFTYPDGEPAKHVRVTFQAADVSMFMQINSPPMETDEDGNIRTPFVEPGKPYTLYLRGGDRNVGVNVADAIVTDGKVFVIDIGR